MTVLATLWGIRLTFNYALKGGYWVGGEDYRWIYLEFQITFLPFPHQLSPGVVTEQETSG